MRLLGALAILGLTAACGGALYYVGTETSVPGIVDGGPDAGPADAGPDGGFDGGPVDAGSDGGQTTDDGGWEGDDDAGE